MTSDLDIYRSAQVLIRQHGKDDAAAKADEAAKAARVVVDEASQIAHREGKALNAGRAVRRAPWTSCKAARHRVAARQAVMLSVASICRSAKSAKTDPISVNLGR